MKRHRGKIINEIEINKKFVISLHKFAGNLLYKLSGPIFEIYRNINTGSIFPHVILN
jgi:hypothetical protein